MVWRDFRVQLLIPVTQTYLAAGLSYQVLDNMGGLILISAVCVGAGAAGVVERQLPPSKEEEFTFWLL